MTHLSADNQYDFYQRFIEAPPHTAKEVFVGMLQLGLRKDLDLSQASVASNATCCFDECSFHEWSVERL